jgi:hypothetical protein
VCSLSLRDANLAVVDRQRKRANERGRKLERGRERARERERGWKGKRERERGGGAGVQRENPWWEYRHSARRSALPHDHQRDDLRQGLA